MGQPTYLPLQYHWYKEVRCGPSRRSVQVVGERCAREMRGLLRAAFLPTVLVAPLLLPRAPLSRLGRLTACAPPQEDTSSGIQVSLRDPETDRTLECHILGTSEIDGQVYASMTPIDTPVAIALFDDDTMVEVDDAEQLDAIFPTACAVCSEMDLTCAAACYAAALELWSSAS